MAASKEQMQSSSYGGSYISSDISQSSNAELDNAIRVLLNDEQTQGLCQGNPITPQGKRLQMAKMLVLTLIPVLALCVMTTNKMSTIISNNRLKAGIRDTLRFSSEIGTVIHHLQKERDMTALHISTMGTETRLFLRERYPDTDDAIDSLSQWPTNKDASIGQFNTNKEFKLYIKQHRDGLNPKLTTVYDEIMFYSDCIKKLIDWLYTSIQGSRDGDAWRTLVAYQLLVNSKEDMGVERTLGGVFYAKGKFANHKDYLWYLERHNIGIGSFEAAKRFSNEIQSIFDKEKSKYENNFTIYIRHMRAEISTNNLTFGRVANWEMSTWWFDNMTIYIDIMFSVQNILANNLMVKLGKSLNDDTEDIALSASLFVLVVIICPTVVLFVRSIINDIQKFAFTLAAQTKELTKERKRTNSLLYKMLPKNVAEKLRNNEDYIAETYDDATVFFSDIVAFTTITFHLEPNQVINILNNLYTIFDARISRYDVYKTETIGDSYMIVSGVPRRNGKRHTMYIADMALDLLHHIGHLEIPHLPNGKMQLRAGIHSGPVIAGIVGRKVPRYCLFGDTVNTCSRMEQYGLPGKILLSQMTHDNLLVDNSYIMTSKNEMEIKGRGKIYTFVLEEKKGLLDGLLCYPACTDKPRKIIGSDISLREIIAHPETAGYKSPRV